MNPAKYRTLSEALQQLIEKGFTVDFKLENDQLLNLKNGKKYRPENLLIVEYHRFEGESNPSDMSILFGIKAIDGVKGSIVSSFGTYADTSLIEFMDKIKILDRKKVMG